MVESCRAQQTIRRIIEERQIIVFESEPRPKRRRGGRRTRKDAVMCVNTFFTRKYISLPIVPYCLFMYRLRSLIIYQNTIDVMRTTDI